MPRSKKIINVWIGDKAEGPEDRQDAGGEGEAPKDFTKPRQTIQSPNRQYKAPTDNTKPRKEYTKHQRDYTKTKK